MELSQRSDVRDQRWRADRSDELLREVRRQVSRPSGVDLGPIVNWLHSHLDAEVALVGSGGAVEVCTTGFRRSVLAAVARLVDQLSSGRKTVASAEIGASHLHLEAMGPNPPRPVLVVAGSAALSPEAATLVSNTGGALAVLSRLREADVSRLGHQLKARQMRFAVLQALLTGDVGLARRMTTGAVPELLDAGAVRIHLLECASDDRDRLALAFQDPSGYHDRAIMVHCPAYREHLICVIADDGDGGGGLRRGEPLVDVVRENPGYALGISAPHPLEATAQAYDQARHALAVARNLPVRVASYRGESPLARLLSPREAARWARTFLRPLAAAPPITTEIAQLGLVTSRSAVARMLGVSRNTVTAHLRRAERLLALDLDDVRDRAALHLALAVDVPSTDLSGESSTTLARLLGTAPATTWAETFLRPLDEKLRATLRAWLAANTDAQRAARMLGLSRDTVRAHLRTAEHLLGRDLLNSGFGVHDVVHALGIVEAPTR